MKYKLLLLLVFLVGCQLEIPQEEIFSVIEDANIDWQACFSNEQGVFGTVRQGFTVKSYLLNNSCKSDLTNLESNEKIIFTCDEKKPQQQSATCIKGCNQGECVSSSSCIDSDQGDKPFIAGTLLLTDDFGNQKTLQDHCISNDQLGEIFCKNNEIGFKTHTCVFGCINNRCLEDRFLAQNGGEIEYSITPELNVVPSIVATGEKAKVVLKSSGLLLSSPSIKYSEKSQLLYDDGFHYDAQAQDGIYATEISFDEPGDYILSVQDPLLNTSLQTTLHIINPSTATCHQFSKNATGKINLVIAAVGYLEELSIVERIVDLEGKYHGIFAVEPFKSNKELFNIWYVSSENFQPQIKNGQLAELNQGFEMLTACDLPNEYNLIVFDNPQYSKHDQLGYGSIKYSYALFTPNTAPVTAVHEFVHAFAGLQDEYDYNKISDDLGIGQCYQAKNVNCNNEICVETANSYQDCLTNAPWNNLIGDGCGEDGIVDCSVDNPDYEIEVNCFLGCGGARNLYRSTFSNGMREIKAPFRLGKVNEKLVCGQIKKLDHTAVCS
jgi:hypothetical protein